MGLQAVLGDFSFQMRPKLKPGSTGRRAVDVEIPTEAAAAAAVECDDMALETQLEDDGYELVVKRTFLSYVPTLRASRSDAQSTTEVHDPESTFHYGSTRGVNPRRCGQVNFQSQPP